MTSQPLTNQQPALDLDEIAARAAGLYEYATGLDDAWQDEADQLAGTDVPALLAEVHRLRAELADFSGSVNQLESKLCDCEPVREHTDYKRPAFYQHEAHCPVTELTQPTAEETHVVADDSDDPEHIDDCPGCEPNTPATPPAV